MSTITCPLCDHEHYDGDYPDMLDGWRGGWVEFECAECRCAFEMVVEMEPYFYPISRTIRPAVLGDPEV